MRSEQATGKTTYGSFFSSTFKTIRKSLLRRCFKLKFNAFFKSRLYSSVAHFRYYGSPSFSCYPHLRLVTAPMQTDFIAQTTMSLSTKAMVMMMTSPTTIAMVIAIWKCNKMIYTHFVSNSI